MLLSASTATECVSISSFALLVGILVRIASSAATIKIFAITEVIKKVSQQLGKRKRNMIR